MKTKFYFLYIFIVSLFSADAYAQKVINEGILAYDISIESTKGEKQVSGSLNGAVLTVYLTKDKSRTDMVSTPGMESAIYDNRSGKGVILKEYSGQKLMITANAENWIQKNKVNYNLRFKTENGTSVIAGYTCSKATAASDDGKLYTVYFDPAITIANKMYNNAFPQLHGLPIQYELQSGNLVFKYTLSKYSTEAISSGKFEAPKGGFRIMTFEENQQLKKVD